MSVNGHDNGEWVFLPEAARRLSVAPQTVRRKLKRGEFESRQVQTRTGLAYQVRLVGDQPLSAQPMLDQPTQGVVELVSLVRDLQIAVTARTEAAAMWQARAEMLAAQLDQAQLALEAPKAEPVATEPTPAIEAVSAPAVRPWWRFW